MAGLYIFFALPLTYYVLCWVRYFAQYSASMDHDHHRPGTVVQSKNVKIIWDFSIVMLQEVYAGRSDMVIIQKERRVDISFPHDEIVQLKMK